MLNPDCSTWPSVNFPESIKQETGVVTESWLPKPLMVIVGTLSFCARDRNGERKNNMTMQRAFNEKKLSAANRS